MKVIVSNIQRFSLHDGTGIRTTIFFKGCNLRCPWCCNPENIDFNIQEYYENNISKNYGYEISTDELYAIIMKDECFYSDNGGVTFSGGECLWQFEKIEDLLIKLKNGNINICIESALTIPKKMVDIALKYVDEYYIDVKILDGTEKEKINGNSKLFKSNFKLLCENNSNITVRIPIVKDYTYTKSNINSIIDFLKDYNCKVEIFKTHELANKKYSSLGMNIKHFDDISVEELNNIKKHFEQNNIICNIISI